MCNHYATGPKRWRSGDSRIKESAIAALMGTTMLKHILTGALLIAGGSTALAAKDKPPKQLPALYAKLAECRQVTDSTQRLACFDAAAANLDAAVAANQVYMVDKQQVQKTRRTLFGLPLPDLGLFGGGGDDEPEAERMAELESTVKSAVFRGDAWTITIAEGSTWQQMDGTPLALSPKPGMPVKITRGALGSYKMSIRKQSAIKVKRIL